MNLTKINGNLSFNYVPDKNTNQLPDTTIIYDINGNNLGTIKELRNKNVGKDTTDVYNDIYYDDIIGGGRKRRRTKKSKRNKRRKTNRRRR